MSNRLAGCRRLVVKIGSTLLVDAEGRLRRAWLQSLCDDIDRLCNEGRQVAVVSSGAIALGRGPLGLAADEKRLSALQAAAAVGQIELAQAWVGAMQPERRRVAQLLLTLEDTETRRRYLNAQETLERLLERSIVPVINENDTVATDEIRYGDNDRLAARVAQMLGADGLVLLSNVDGLLSADPKDASAKLIPEVESITPEIEALASAGKSTLGRGGMRSKLEAARIATDAGCHVYVANGTVNSPLRHFFDGGLATWFHARAARGAARKRWIAASLKRVASVTVDDGAAAALDAGNSLLAVGVVSASGTFSQGDLISILNPESLEIARGLSACDSSLVIGKGAAKDDTRGRLVCHRNDLVMASRTDE